jgi:hypothetical protein
MSPMQKDLWVARRERDAALAAVAAWEDRVRTLVKHRDDARAIAEKQDKEIRHCTGYCTPIPLPWAKDDA